MLKECKDILPQIHLRYGKELASNRDIDNAIIQIKNAITTAKANSMDAVVTEATELLPQLLMADANSYINEGKFPEAIAGYKKVLNIEPTNAVAYLRIGMCESKLNNEDAAVVAYEKALELGDKEDAGKQLSVLYLKRSIAAYKTKNWAGTFENAKKSNEYAESGQGYKLQGIAAVQLKKYDDAIESLEKYFAQDPNAKDKNSTIYNLALAFEGKNNTAKACGYYKQLLSDPTYKAIAEYKVKTQFKCN
jgi:tetratricopeptide (TPR) repeat protein